MLNPAFDGVITSKMKKSDFKKTCHILVGFNYLNVRIFCFSFVASDST